MDFVCNINNKYKSIVDSDVILWGIFFIHHSKKIVTIKHDCNGIIEVIMVVKNISLDVKIIKIGEDYI